jgi:hypothetical protein
MVLRDTPALLNSMADILTSFVWCQVEVLITKDRAKLNWLDAIE